MTPINPDAIPIEMRSVDRWVGWRVEQREGKPTKVPINPTTGQRASSTSSSSWSSFAAAVESVKRFKLEGVGFVFGDGWSGVDLDGKARGCRDPQTGELQPWAREIVDALQSYTEASPSGKGTHTIVRATLPEGARCKSDDIEIYSRDRFFTVTGDRFEGTSTYVEDRQAQLEALHARVFPPKVEPVRTERTRSSAEQIDDDKLVEIATKHSANGPKFARLWSGDTSGYPSASEADYALLALLSFWTRDDKAQIERMFRASGLMRDKLNSKRGNTTLLLKTIDRVVGEAHEVWTPRPKPEPRADWKGYTPTDEEQPPPEDKDHEPEVKPDADPLALLRAGGDLHAALTEFARLVLPLDPLKRRLLRDEAIKILKTAGNKSAAGTVDAALKTADADEEPDRLTHDVAPWPEEVDGAELLQSIVDGLERFLVLPVGAAETIATWCLYSHLYARFDISPILRLKSPLIRCGKTATLEVIERIVPRVIRADNMSAATIFRLIEAEAPTLLLDEVDCWIGGDNADIRNMLNSGARRGGVVARVEGGSDSDRRVVLYKVFGPKVVAGIGKLSPSIEDRSIMVELQRKTLDQKRDRARTRALDQLRDLGRKCARWAVDHGDDLDLEVADMPDLASDRAIDCWEPLISVADEVGAPWSERLRAAALGLAGSAEDDQLAVELLRDLHELFELRGVENLLSKDICVSLIAREERPWGDIDGRGHKLDQRALARLLAPFGVRPKTVRCGDQRGWGYSLFSVKDTFASYLV